MVGHAGRYRDALKCLDSAIVTKRDHRSGRGDAIGLTYSLTCKGYALADQGNWQAVVAAGRAIPRPPAADAPSTGAHLACSQPRGYQAKLTGPTDPVPEAESQIVLLRSMQSWGPLTHPCAREEADPCWCGHLGNR